MAERLFTVERCRKLLTDVVEETGVLRSKTAAQRKRMKDELDEVERKIAKWETAFEDGDLDPADGARRVRTLRARQRELEGALGKIVPIHKPPPNLYTEANITRFQANLRRLFLRPDRTLAKNYLRMLVDRIEVLDTEIKIVANTDPAVRMLAGGPTTAGELTAEAVSPTTVLDWLPKKILRRTGPGRRREHHRGVVQCACVGP